MTSRAQQIVDQILQSERYKSSSTFSERVYTDEPILRAGAKRPVPAPNAPQTPAPRKNARATMPSRYRGMRALARKHPSRNYRYGTGMAKLFYEQGKYMEDFEDDFAGTVNVHLYYPTYNEMSDFELRSYFTWRTHLRAGEAPEAPLAFLFVHAYELLCGIGVTPGEQAYRQLQEFWERYAGASNAFDAHISRWSHDYAIFYGLDRSLLPHETGSFPLDAVSVLRQAEHTLLLSNASCWPTGSSEGLPSTEELLDALCMLSRYRAEKSRFFRDRRADVAEVCAQVFARMVAHCHKRRKTDYVDGLFGAATRMSYSMFPSAVFWSPTPHADTAYEVSPSERYTCEQGFWWRLLPCRRTEKSRELGALLHAVDSRMRTAAGDAHPLKERPLPKYQKKFVDEEIAALMERRAAEEAAHVEIDRSALRGIRTASARTREALLTDEEREETDAPQQGISPEPAHPEPTDTGAVSPANGPALTEGLGLNEEQSQLLWALLNGTVIPKASDSLFLTLAVDAINEAFLDSIGDTVIEFEGERPVLVEDYEDDVREALAP